MHPVRKQRLWIVLFIVVFSTIAIGLVVYSLRENLNLFYPPAKILSGEAPLGRTIRAGGCVVPGSVVQSDSSLRVDFKVTDGVAELPVTFEGILPDLFAEGEAAVLTGKLLDSGVFDAQVVLAKHDEKYTPSEVADTVQNTEQHQATCDGLDYNSGENAEKSSGYVAEDVSEQVSKYGFEGVSPTQ